MKVKIESLFAQKFFRISFWVDGHHRREYVPRNDSETWTRKHSIKALNLLERVYRVNRKKVRFVG
jgi:hypothetical protein